MGRPKSSIDLRTFSEGYWGTKDAAAMLGASVSTIQKVVEGGHLEAWRTQGGHRRITLASLRREIDRLPSSHVAPRQRPLTMLVVEDNPVALKAYSHIFQPWGERISVRYAHDGAEALLLVAQEHPDVLITDIVMQPFDGHTLIRTLRANAQLAGLHIVVVTGAAEADTPSDTFDARAAVYRKPLRAERLACYIDARLQDLALRSVR